MVFFWVWRCFLCVCVFGSFRFGRGRRREGGGGGREGGGERGEGYGLLGWSRGNFMGNCRGL